MKETNQIIDKYDLEYEHGKIVVKIIKEKPVPRYTISLVEISDNVRKVMTKIREHVTSQISFDIVKHQISFF